MKKLLFVLGTRPEALKLAPLIALAKRDKAFKTKICLTGQHREMVDQVFDFFKLCPDYDLNLMQKGQTLGDLTQRVFLKFHGVLRREKPDLIIVQGDTTTAFTIALQAFYEKIPVAHVEAGLRSYDKYQPFPEEVNRVLISHLADYHFAPTRQARSNLLREGVSSSKIFVTGNTVVDALRSIHQKLSGMTIRAGRRPFILVTAHRRENLGKPMVDICEALLKIVRSFPKVEIVFPVHLNPKVRKTVFAKLKKHPRIVLCPPLVYNEFVRKMSEAIFILTDSGGVQEEAPSFGKRVLVMREVTERPEGVRAGIAKLVGTDPKKIFREASRLLSSPRNRQKNFKNPYGDGKASLRILKILKQKVITL